LAGGKAGTSPFLYLHWLKGVVVVLVVLVGFNRNLSNRGLLNFNFAISHQNDTNFGFE